MKKKCIVDSSSAILLYKANIFSSFLSLYSVSCPESVYSELTKHMNYPGALSFIDFQLDGTLLVHPSVNNSKFHDKNNTGSLGRGEADCIKLFFLDDYDFIILDDRKGGGYCRRTGIPYINALLVPRILLLTRIIADDECNRIFLEICAEGRYSKEIIDYARIADSDELRYFLP